MDSFLIAVNAVVPFLMYISFGYLVRETGIVDEAFMRRMNQLVFKAFFPIIMFYNIYHKEAAFTMDGRLVAVGIVSVLLLIGVLMAVVPRIVKEDAKRGVVIQAIYRSNFVLFAIPLTESIFGSVGTATASVMVAIIIPIYNVSAIIILEYFRGGKANFSDLMKKVLTNPMIIGTLVGLLFSVLHIILPACVEKPVAQFANLTTPLALFILGGTLHFSSVRGHAKYLVAVLSVKLLLIPAVVLLITFWFDFDPISRFVYFTMFATPVATASYAMASNMGGDGELAGELVVMSTAVSVVTIFFWILFMKHVGFI